MKTVTLLLGMGVGTLLLTMRPACSQPASTNQTDDVRVYFEALRSDFNTTKIHTINSLMKLTGPEADAFWPIYRQYEKELAGVGDEKLALIREFFTRHRNGTLDDATAKTAAERWLKNVQARLDLWKEYHRKISAAVSPIRAAQFLQVENQVALFVDMAIASEMPQVELPTAPGTGAKPGSR